jgi:phosphoglycerate dehydrogenase-like enzyme
MQARIAVLDDYQRIALGIAPWADLGGEVEVTAFSDHLDDDEEVVERLAPFDIVVAMRERTPFPRSRLERLPALRLLVTTGMGNAAIGVEAARELGITVCGTGGLPSHTAELTWGLILALTRSIPAEDRQVRDGGWQHTIGPELAGRTLGIAGLGRLGTRVARVAHAFEMPAIAWSENLDRDHAAAIGVEPVGKDEMFERAEIITIHLRLSDRTRGLVGAAELARMGPSAYLVNTSRGPIVDELALVAALEAGTIAGAALDVYDREPLPADHPLRTAPNTVLTPHIGFVTTGTYEIFYGDAVEDIAGFLRGEPVRVVM